jgi:hypothetical protein
MTIPSNVKNTVSGYLEYLGDAITMTDKLWTHYGWAVSKAYADAYSKNLSVLGGIKIKQEQDRARNEAFMSFALSLLTVGVAGGVAGALARTFAKKVADGSKVAEDVSKDVLKWSQQQAAAPLIKTVSATLSPEVSSGDVFSPSDTSPEQYTTGVQEGISYNLALLQKILFDAKWDPSKKNTTVGDKVITLRSGGELTTEGARLLADAITSSSFVSDPPPIDVDIANLTRKAKLALWIGWALARDADYWNSEDAPIMNYIYDAKRGWVPLPVGPAFWEQLTWEPVRQAVVDVGGMYQAVTMQSNMPVGGGNFQIKKGLYMRGFMEWAASPQALAQLFDSAIPKNKTGFDMVAKAQTRRKLTPHGWTSSSPFTPKMSPE